MSSHLGELAALSAAICWAFSGLAFEVAGRRVGSLVVNLLRLVFAFALLLPVSWLQRGHPLPTDANAHQWIWLLLSGAVGFAVGDLCLFRAYVVLGARLASLMMATVPVITAVVGWIALREQLSALSALAVALVCAGIGWALLARPRDPAAAPSRGTLVAGTFLSFGGAAGQAGGLVLSKYGMDGYSPLASTQIRMVAGLAIFTVLFFAIGWWGRVRDGIRDLRGVAQTALGALFGPFLGVSLSLFAVQHTHTGVAATLMSTTPLVVLVYVALVRREPVGWGGSCGAVIAVVGVALLFLS